MKKAITLIGILLATLLAGCGRPDHAANRLEFENPGGMWMPHQLKDQADHLESLGMDNPRRLADLHRQPLGAIVWLGGCSASFVSDQGLIATNHHCARGSLQFYSSPGRNLLNEGFLANSLSEELAGETGKKVWVTRDIIDVTKTVRKGLEKIDDPLDRHQLVEDRVKAVIAEHEDESSGIRCLVRSFYEGKQYYLFEQFEIKDVRLVHAPPLGIGYFGGDIDNWHWPRHTGDYTFYRAYVAPDGGSAEYSPDNVPYRPKYWLRVADKPLEPHDFVMVAGYPGRTQRWQTAGEVIFDFEVRHPRLIYILNEVAEVYRGLADQSEDLEIKVAPSLFGTMNYLQNLQLVQENIERAGLIEEKVTQQQTLEDWIAAAPDRAEKWGAVLDDIARVNEANRQTWYRDYLVSALTNYVSLLDAAHTIVRMAEERPKPDEERDPSFQKRNWDRTAQSLERMQVSYDPAINKALLAFYLGKLSELPAEQRDEVRGYITESPTTGFIDGLFTESLTLDKADARVDLYRSASLEDLRASSDPFIQLALRLRPLTKAIEESDKTYGGKMLLLRPEYVRAVQALSGRPLASDANGTLRVTYGTVKGYRPAPGAPVYEPFTTLAGVVKKSTGEEPFNSPPKLHVAAAAVSPRSPYYSELLNDVPANFLSDCDITGGNSGSATLDAEGRWIGLVFDGNSESLASDWVYMPDVTRAIHVDVRYILWVMENVAGADNLLRELGVKR